MNRDCFLCIFAALFIVEIQERDRDWGRDCNKMCSTVLPCPLCCQPNFHSVDSLRISLVNVTNRPLECPICCDVLFGLDKLTIHLFSHTLNRDSVADTKYDNNVSNVNLSMQTSGPDETKSEPLCCDIQVNESLQKDVLKQQRRWHESVVEQERKPPLDVEPQCDICGSRFRTLELHRMHLKLVHEISDDIIQSTETVYAERDSKNCFQCHLCAKVFKMKGSLRVHLRVVHSFGKTGRLPLLDGVQHNATSSNNATETHGMHNAENKLNNLEVKSWECDICAKCVSVFCLSFTCLLVNYPFLFSVYDKVLFEKTQTVTHRLEHKLKSFQ